MTRINVVPIEELTDNFILAEYYELPRIYVQMAKHFEAGQTPANLDIPETYRMGKGHMRFFYDKAMYLVTRHYWLAMEGTKRGLELALDPTTTGYHPPVSIHSEWWKDYIPTPEAIQLNRDRLQYRRRYDGGVYQV